MASRTAVSKFALGLLFGWIFTGCKNAGDIPFPQETNDHMAPVKLPLHFGAAQKLVWPEKPGKLTSVPGNFNFDKLPVIQFDSAGFNRFRQAPEEKSFDWNNLPGADFNYDSLREIPLHFKMWVLPPPEITKVNKPVLKNGKPEIIYDFGDQLNGVPIQALFQSKDGFTWIAADKLYRYDGENLYSYAVNGISSFIFDLSEDRDGKLWIITNGNGLFFLDFKNGVSGQLSSREGLLSNFGVRLIADHENRIWATFLPDAFRIGSEITGGAVIIIDQDKKVVRFLQTDQGLSTGSPSCLIEDRENNIWVSTINAGLNFLDLKNKRIKYLDKAHGLNTDTLSALIEDQSGGIWVSGFFGGVNVVNRKKGTIKKFDEQQGFSKSFIGRMIKDHQGNIWIGGDNGVKIVNRSQQFVKSIDQSSGLNDQFNSQLTEDARHQFLVGTRSGLNIISKNGRAIHRAGNTPISSLLADTHGRVWIGTLNKGIQILDTATGLVKIYNQAQGLSDDLIQYMVEYDGNIVLSTQKGGIEIIDTSLRKIERIGKAQGLSTANITAIEKDKENNLWLGGVNSPGIDILDLKNKKISHIGLSEGLNDTTITDIKKDHKGLMWTYSQNRGIGKIDIDAKTVQYLIRSDFKTLTGAVEDNLLMHDPEGNVWLVSSVNGLFAINPARDSITHFTTAQGLLSNQVTSVKEYHGRIFAGTSNGLNILTPPSLTPDKKWKIESLGKGEGIAKNAFTYNSDLILPNGQYWWGDAGITIIGNLGEIINDTIVPATHITGFDIFNRSQFFVKDPWENVNEKDTIWNSDRKNNTFYTGGNPTPQTAVSNRHGMKWDSINNLYNLPVNLRLPYDKNYLQFHFAQLHLGSQDTVWYRYILEGIDKQWSEKTYKGSSENYPGIPSGDYKFKVSGFYRGKWGEPVVYPFTIAPPWWKTWWALLSYIIIFGAIVRAFIEYRSRSLIKEKKVLEQKVKLRTDEVLKQKEEISAQRDNLEKTLDELKSTQSQLIQSEKMASLGELTAGIAHEIQNPLNFINNFSEVNTELIIEMKEEIEKGNLDGVKNLADDIALNEQKISHHGKRADGIVKGMLQHSRTGNRQKEAANINRIADEYLRLAYHGLRAKDKSFNAVIHTDFDEMISDINVIPQDIGRVILNLITNAFYAVTEKKKQLGGTYEPTITVRTKKTGDKVEVSVRDNGNGVPQRVLDKIFQPFFTTKPTGEGTGLGLSLSYDIVKAHHGELRVETKEGEFAEFIILLPV